MIRILEGDCLNVLKTLPANSVDSCVTDPPYHLTSIVKRFGRTNTDRDGTNERRAKAGADAMARLSRGFMGQQWDGGDVAFQTDTWRAVLRVLKPGGQILVFGGTRTWHRLACAIEDAGFEVRDTLCWLYGTGFPKSHNLADDWQGWGTALKPAFEPIILARKPLDHGATVAANVLAHGTGAINIDACRIPTSDADKAAINAKHAGMDAAAYQRPCGVSLQLSVKPMPLVPAEAHTLGRWPSNVLHDGSDEVEAAFAAFGTSESDTHQRHNGDFKSVAKGYDRVHTAGGHGDSGTASRFFYSAKAGKAERAGSKHPTVKPLALMRWLVRLITPPGGMIIDPFAGSGTTGEAAMLEGFDATLIELVAEYAADIRRRINRWSGEDMQIFACTSDGLEANRENV